MIPFHYDYYKPDTLENAVTTYSKLNKNKKKAIYYGGGTEISNRAKLNKLWFNAVIDINGIPECNILEFQNNHLVIGSAVTLNKICDSNLFPFLCAVSKRAANEEARKKITIGGNLCGCTPYRETALPLLLSNCQATIAGDYGIKNQPLNEIFNNEMKLSPGELLVQLSIYKDNIYSFHSDSI